MPVAASDGVFADRGVGLNVTEAVDAAGVLGAVDIGELGAALSVVAGLIVMVGALDRGGPGWVVAGVGDDAVTDGEFAGSVERVAAGAG